MLTEMNPYANATHGSPITIRPAQLDDAATVQHMCWPDRSPEQITHMVARAQKLKSHKRGVGVVGLWETTLCAFGQLTLWPQMAEISDLHVNTSFRNRGIGSLIIAYLTHEARLLRVETLEIGVACTNPKALALYRRLGFKDDRTIHLELGNGPEPVLYLKRKLTPLS